MTQANALQRPANNNRALQVVEGDFGQNKLANLNISDVNQLAKAFKASEMFPDLKSEAQAAVKIIAGHELGFSPIVSITGIHFFQGRVVVGANLLASLIKDSGKYEYKIVQHTDKICSAQFMQKFGGKFEDMGVPVTYTWADAETAGLTSKSVWKSYPKDMLFAAVIRQGARRYCADILRGTSIEHDNEFEQKVDEFDVPQNAEKSAPAAENAEPILGEVVESKTETAELSHIDRLKDEASRKLQEKTGGDAEAIDSILKGRVIDKMTKPNLTALIEDLDAI